MKIKLQNLKNLSFKMIIKFYFYQIHMMRCQWNLSTKIYISQTDFLKLRALN